MSSITPKLFFLDIEVSHVPSQFTEKKRQRKKEPMPCITQIALFDPENEEFFNRYVYPNPELCKKDYSEKFKEKPNGEVAQNFGAAWQDLVNWQDEKVSSYSDRQIVWIGHNIYKWDWVILNAEVNRWNGEIPSKIHPFCTLYLKKALKLHGDGSLSRLCDQLNVEKLKAHDAKHDAKMSHNIFMKMIGDAPLKEVLPNALLPRQKHPVKSVAKVIQAYRKVSHVFLDFEGTAIKDAHAVQVALYMPEGKEKLFSQLINPNISIPRDSSAVHGFYNKDVIEAPAFKEAWLKLDNFIKINKVDPTSTTIFWGHNIWGYDYPLYKSECERVGLRVDRFKCMDTLGLLRSLYKGIVSPYTTGFFKQEYISPLLGIDIIDAHDAGGDVQVNYELFKKLTEGLPIHTINQKIHLKHPGKSLAQEILDKGKFDPYYYKELHQDICQITIDFAKELFQLKDTNNYYSPNNLATLLDIVVGPKDSEEYIKWRIFLKLTEGVLRKEINEAMKEENPIGEILDLCNEKGTFNTVQCMKNNAKAIKCVGKLAKELFPEEEPDFFNLKTLAKEFKVKLENASEEEEFEDIEITVLDKKRLFMALTKGPRREEVYQLLNEEEAIKNLANLIKEKGTIIQPEEFVEVEKMKQDINQWIPPPVDPVLSFDDFFEGSSSCKKRKMNNNNNYDDDIIIPDRKKRKLNN